MAVNVNGQEIELTKREVITAQYAYIEMITIHTPVEPSQPALVIGIAFCDQQEDGRLLPKRRVTKHIVGDTFKEIISSLKFQGGDMSAYDDLKTIAYNLALKNGWFQGTEEIL